MFSGRGRGRGGGGRAALRSSVPGSSDRGKDTGDRGDRGAPGDKRARTVAGQALGRTSSRSPARGQAGPGARSQSATPTTGGRGKLKTVPPPRSASPKTGKKRSLGKVSAREDAENSDVTQAASAKSCSEEKAAELVTESIESKTVQKPVRKQKLPKLNDNPDAPEVVDVPNMRSSHVERLSDTKTYENGTSVNGDCDKQTGEALDDTEILKESKVTFAGRMPPLITGTEDKCAAQSAQARDKPGENGTDSVDISPDKSDSIVLIPLSDESCDAKGAGDATKEDSAETKDELDGQGDEMLTNMIRENLNKAVSISNDSSNASSVDEMKQSLLNAIKDTLESSNSKSKPEDAGEDSKEEVITNGDIVNGDHAETEDTGEDSSELDKKPGDVKNEEEEEMEKLENGLVNGDLHTDIIANAEIEISPEPVDKNGSLSASGDGINDLIIDIQSSKNLDSSDSFKEKVPTVGSATITSLDQLEKGMLPVDSVQIEHVDTDGAVPSGKMAVAIISDMPGISVVVTEEAEKPKLNIDKDKLFSQMNDIFAKDTHKALKNKPVYQKRGRLDMEDQAETKQKSPPAKKKKLKVLKKKKSSSNIEISNEDPLVKNEEEGSESMDSEDIPPPVLERNDACEDIKREEDSKMGRETPTTSDNSNDVEGNNPENVPEKEEAAETEPMDELEKSMDELEKKLEELEEGLAEENSEEEEKIDCDIEEESIEETVPNENKGDAADEVEKKNLNSPKETNQSIASSSELTKSLRKARPFKKSPSKTPCKDKSWEEDPASEGDQEESVMDEARTSPSPAKDLPSSVPKVGPDVFDFTDEEDLPLSNIDLDVLDASDKSCQKSGVPEPQPTLDHELSGLSSSKSSPNKLPRRPQVAPQILSVTDAVAAVAALQVGFDDIKEDLKEDEDADDVKMNGEAGSDGDTDNSTSNGRSSHFSEKAKVSVKRKKRRVTESDDGETEDDSENNKKDLRPKRIKNVSGPGESGLRPASAASVTSVTSEDRRELEDIRRIRETEGKLTPDSQRSEDIKSLTKAFSTVVPEKASSFKIHPERTCADCCFYCNLKFGMLDTPLHIAQLKTQEKQEFAMEFTKFDRDACLCDRCFRFLDRRAASKDMNGAKSIIENKDVKEDKVKKCIVRTCNRQVTSHVSKKWLIRLKKKLSKKVGLDWEKVTKASVKATFPICPKHNVLIEFYSNCGLCKRKLTVGGICTLGMSHQEVEEMNVLLREDHIPADLKENNFVCKLCKTFCGIKQKSLQPDYLKNHKTYKAFYKDYRRKLYVYLELGEDDKSPNKLPKKLFKVSQSGDSGSLKISISAHTPDMGGPDKRKRKEKEFLSPSDESRIQVVNDASPDLKRTAAPGEKCSVSINFDLNTKKLWQELHYPYGSYTSFFRHLILLEKYWRSGDLALAPEAGIKPSAYLKSVQNRISSYEGKQLASQDDLSAVTRPDLSGPAPPKLVHTPGEAVLANLPLTSSPKLEASLRSPEAAGTILRIPRVPRSGSLLSPGAGSEPPGPATHVTPSPKIRVRQDLMNHLGLVAASKPSPAPVPASLTVTTTPSAPPPTSHLRAALTVTPVSAPASHSTPNLAKLLSDSSPALPAHSDAGSPPDSAPIKSSNSQLFKSSESTGAIPLTFNNSIAEVLAAASKAKNAKSREPSPKPEITITAKSSNKTKELSQVLAASNKTTNSPVQVGGHKLPASVTQTPSFGGLSILKKPASTSASPLSNMTKLLQAQSPGLPPHVIAQQTLPASTQARSASKVMSRPPGPVMSNLRPVQISGGPKPSQAPQGIQTVNKKSLNTVLDRLGGLGTSTAPVKPAVSSSNSSSSLVQQLQAPPMTSRPGPKSFKESNKKSIPAPVASPVGPVPGLSISVPPVIGQPMVQFPGPALDPGSLLSQSLLLGPNPAAAQAALMMAGLNGLTPQQAQQAMQELLQQQQILSGHQQPRLRAPPPLKNMAAARKPE